jgi:hypothetical protein
LVAFAEDRRAVQSPSGGEIVAFPEVGGLHYRYERRAVLRPSAPK